MVDKIREKSITIQKTRNANDEGAICALGCVGECWKWNIQRSQDIFATSSRFFCVQGETALAGDNESGAPSSSRRAWVALI